MRRALLLLAITLALAACGKKGDLDHKDGVKPTYPKTYPRQ